MPNYGKSKTTFSRTNQTWDTVPWAELRNAYNSCRTDLETSKQASLDRVYEEQIAELEQEYNDSNEAPYEGYFGDQLSRPKAVVSEEAVQKLFKPLAETFTKTYVKPNVGWLLPLIVTYLGNMKTYKLDSGKLSGLQFRNRNFLTDQDKGLYRFLLINERSTFLTAQTQAPSKSYCSMVPLVLYAHKLMHQTPYSLWDPEEIHYVVHSDLADAMTSNPEDFSKDELLEQRHLGLLDKLGNPKNAETSYNLTGPHLKTGIFADVPKLARMMLVQSWCAHPNNRTRYMVLDPNNWDKMPAALISTEVFEPIVSTKPEAYDDWN
jgi:hypothetical protein